MKRFFTALSLVFLANVATAAPRKVAVYGFDQLGLDTERVTRLETLFRVEVERLVGSAVQHITANNVPRGLPATCVGSGEISCAIKLGALVQADWVVFGQVAAVADSYTMFAKVIDVNEKKELARYLSQPLRGESDQLISEIRLVAYQLLAPQDLVGELLIVTDLQGGTIKLDGKAVGTTPLSSAIPRIPIGNHTVTVEAPGFSKVEEKVVIRFQKTSRAIVLPKELLTKGTEQKNNSSKTGLWIGVAVGVVAVAAGIFLGYKLSSTDTIDCNKDMPRCTGN